MNLLLILVIGFVAIFFISAKINVEPFSNPFTTTMKPAIYNVHEYGHPKSAYSYKPYDMGEFYSYFHHYKPFHYGYGERAYGTHRPYASFWF